MSKERGKYPWGYLPKRVRIEARRKAQGTLDLREKLQNVAAKRGETDYAGFLPIAELLQTRLRLRSLLDVYFDFPKGRAATYSSTDMPTGLISMMIMGLENVRQISKFALEVVPAEAVGLEKFYGEDTLRRMLDCVQAHHVEQIREVHRRLRHQERRRILGTEGDIDVGVDFSPLSARDAPTATWALDSAKSRAIKAGV